MKKSRKKGLKPLLIQSLALVIGICYLANPLHHQISTVFHEASHLFTMPNSVMSHSDSKASLATHSAREHDYAQEAHRHSIVDILDSIFEAADHSDDSSENALIFEIKFDKHLSKNQFTFQQKIYTKHRTKSIVQRVEKINMGHCEVLIEPPQNKVA
ncbi:hypothetical protein [Pareuzebyella sediminis]|uniref:hypothetical protein n=1 Tax=Pareuzebyella sediminis TaxID=2607998 RepID=UPI0011F01A24|nr:hypothetical protein [Pareuzebyella sediminis]